jgi:hypothetical protein
MSYIDYLDGYAYHMVHLDNLQSIFQRRALLSKRKVLQENISYRSIAFEDVQSLRDRIYILDVSNRKYRALHNYVPFYFSTITPMLYVQYINGIQEKIVFFKVSRSILKDKGVIFTDGNATNQQLRKQGKETVYITPITVTNPSCIRNYTRGGPFGTNQNRSDFYADPIFLDRLNWSIINSRWFLDEESTRIKHAEILYPDLLPLARLEEIIVSTRSMVDEVNSLIKEIGMAGSLPYAVCQPKLYFS